MAQSCVRRVFPPVSVSPLFLAGVSTDHIHTLTCYRSSRASGFIGVGFAFRPMYSRFWTMLPDDALQRYAYRGMRNTTSKVALLSVNDAQKSLDLDSNEGMDSEDDALVEGDNGASSSLVWSEPLASMDELDDAGNNQGISFPSTYTIFFCVEVSNARSCRVRVKQRACCCSCSRSSSSVFPMRVVAEQRWSRRWCGCKRICCY